VNILNLTGARTPISRSSSPWPVAKPTALPLLLLRTQEIKIQYKENRYHIRELWTRVWYYEGSGLKYWRSRHFQSSMITIKNAINEPTSEEEDTVPTKLVLHTAAHPSAHRFSLLMWKHLLRLNNTVRSPFMRNENSAMSKILIKSHFMLQGWNNPNTKPQITLTLHLLRPPLWSCGQSSWLQIQRSGFYFRSYHIFWEV
jgi:hypothetical protein